MFSGSCDKGWRKILLSRSLIWQTQLQFPLPHSVEYRCEKKLLTLHIRVPLTQSPCSRSKLERGWEWLLGHITDQYKTICFCKQGCTIGSVTRASCKKKTKKTHNNQTKTPNTTENWTKKNQTHSNILNQFWEIPLCPSASSSPLHFSLRGFFLVAGLFMNPEVSLSLMAL